MKVEIGFIKALFRYPVKSMAGIELSNAQLGFHGIEGDRRFAFRRIADQGGFPFLTAGKLPKMILYKPYNKEQGNSLIPSHVQTPDGHSMELQSNELNKNISDHYGSEVQLMQFRQGIFDDATISLISTSTILKIENASQHSLDVRRFRPNILIETFSGIPFEEDQWVGKKITFGEEHDPPSISITLRDLRCVMVNLDPDTAASEARILKSISQLNETYAGAYATVTKTGNLSVGQKIYLAE